MGRNFVSAFRQELTNLDKDPDSHKTTMSNLRSIVKDLDAKVIHVFVAQLSETKEIGSESGGYTVSLFEDLAHAHGVKIAPHVERIMPVIIRTLSSSEGSLRVQQACSKAVAAIARYGIDPATPEDKKRNVIRSLCKPLSDSLLDSQHQQHLALGSALCLKSLVDCDNWRYATDEMVNNVCQSLAVALEATSSEANSHMALVMALAKHNSFIVEAYARLFVKSGLRILDLGVVEGDSRKRFIAIQMLNFLMKNLDPKSICSELELIFQEVEKHVFDAEKCKTRNSCSGSTESTPSLADMGNDLDNNLWWDIENCLVPTDCPPDLVCAKISKKLFDEGFTGPVNKIKVIAANSSSVPKRILDGIRDEVDYTEYNTVGNDFADIKIKEDIDEWMESNPAPQNVLLITRDNGFEEIFIKLQAHGYTTLNVYVTSGTNELKAIPYVTKAWEMRSFLDVETL